MQLVALDDPIPERSVESDEVSAFLIMKIGFFMLCAKAPRKKNVDMKADTFIVAGIQNGVKTGKEECQDLRERGYRNVALL